MKVHEYQAKSILAQRGIPVPQGKVAATPGEAREAAASLGGKAVVKAQVHAGGRGKAGGVRLVASPREAETVAASLLGRNLATHQTGPQGVPVRKVLVEETVQLARELYVAILIDRAARGPVVIASEAGGMDIEEVALRTPEKIHRAVVDPVVGLQPYQGRNLAYAMGLPSDLVRPFSQLLVDLYRLFMEMDCTLVELNPLGVAQDGHLLAVDAKVDFEDDALFRHPELESMRDLEQMDPLEARAVQLGVSYVKLDGDVACLVNGAGLAMATLDAIKGAGWQPANFLDVGGRADQERVLQSFLIILDDTKVKKMLLNIFGGILRCDMVASALVQAWRERNSTIPIVARLLGTNAAEGKQVLAQSGLSVTFADTIAEAAEKVKELR